MPDLDRWSVVLDELEGRVESCLSGRTDLLTGWEPALGLGPLPAELAERAAALAVAQRDALAHLESERIRVAGELSATRTPSRPARPEMGVYFDATA